MKNNIQPKEIKKIARRKFIKNTAGTAICYACLPSGVLAKSANTMNTNTTESNSNKEHLAAVCGTFCGACPAYLAKHSKDEQILIKRQKILLSAAKNASKAVPNPHWMDGILCDGCLSDGEIATHCQHCAMKDCAKSKENVTRCSDCSELPCSRITNFINTGLLHRGEYLPNLARIKEMGVQEWVKYEEKRWSCPGCGLSMSWYGPECARCGEPRSEQLFSLG